MICVQVPATTANFGAGFDSLGAALDYYNRIWMEEWDGCWIEILDDTLVPTDETNLIYQTAKALYERCGRPFKGLHIRQENRIPTARGLGSSSACIAGGLLAANELLGRPCDQAQLVDLAAEEQEQNARPAIKARVTNMDDYGVVFIGYPIWWSDMPQILYTFFDTYDFSGKTIIPFSTHGGSGFAGTPRTIQGLEPNATMLDGLTISRNNIQNARQEIIDWVNDLDI